MRHSQKDVSHLQKCVKLKKMGQLCPIKKNLLQLEKEKTDKKCFTVGKMGPSQKNVLQLEKMGLSQKDV